MAPVPALLIRSRLVSAGAVLGGVLALAWCAGGQREAPDARIRAPEATTNSPPPDPSTPAAAAAEENAPPAPSAPAEPEPDAAPATPVAPTPDSGFDQALKKRKRCCAAVLQLEQPGWSLPIQLGGVCSMAAAGDPVKYRETLAFIREKLKEKMPAVCNF